MLKLLEFILLKIIINCLKILPFNTSSKTGITILKMIIPFTNFKEKACKNIKIALPHTTTSEQNNIIDGMLNNLGRLIGEFPHINSLSTTLYKKIIKIKGRNNLKYLKKGGLIFCAHFGNWEMIPHFFRHHDQNITIVYMSASNPYTNELIFQYRKFPNVKFVNKGRYGARMVIAALKKQEIVVMLVDQRMRNGMPVEFFGKKAMTATAIANLALNHQCPILPICCKRLKDNFIIQLYKPININLTGEKSKNIYNIMLKINKIIEAWIYKNPEQWFWIHNRWSRGKTHL